MRQAGTRCFPQERRQELERPPGYAPGLRDWQTRVLLLDDGRELVEYEGIEPSVY
jgi:hypothetical protein